MKKWLGTFQGQVLFILSISLSLSGYALWRWGSAEMVSAMFAGALLATVNGVAGYSAIRFAFDKSYTTFLRWVLGGMGVRMFVLLVAVLLLLAVVKVHTLTFLCALLFFYAVFLILEIIFLQKKMMMKIERYDRRVPND